MFSSRNANLLGTRNTFMLEKKKKEEEEETLPCFVGIKRDERKRYERRKNG